MRTHTERKLKNVLGPVRADLSRVEELKDKLSQSEERYRTILDQMQDSYYEVDLAGNYTFVSESAGHSLGYSREEMMGKNYRFTALEEDTESIFAIFNGVYRTGKPNRGFPHRIRHKDGSIIFSEVSVDLKRDEQGVITGFKCVSRDITGRRQMEEELRESEELFRTLLENAPDGVYMNDLEGNFLYGNRKCEEIIGYERGELIGKNFLELNILPENSLARAAQLLQDNINGKSTGPDELELIKKDGRRIPIEINTNVVPRKGQTVVLAFVRDITERKYTEVALQNSEEKYRNLFDNASEAIFVAQAGKIVFLNPRASCISGYSSEELMASPFIEFIHPDDRELVTDRHLRRLKGEELPPLYEFRIIQKNGGTRWAELHAVVISWESKQATLNFLEDITERKLAEEKLGKSYKSLKKTLNDAIETMVKIVEMRDPYTAGHQRKVADLAIAIAKEMKFEDSEIEQLKMAALIHDIGKIYVPTDILNKPGKLSEIELQLIKSHSQYGYDIVRGMNCPCSVAQAILQHHERLDGSGYPNRLKGEDTLLEAKILAVADVVEAIASHRPYRPAQGVHIAMEEISKNKGKLYDPDVVDACLKLFTSGKFEFKPI
ncbi:MAG: PAS domain S-box protein [Dehalococcoidia bacterium]|jgi:PAS domain S-box-containing protein/putative nucleotidyltransferase with HDIG domain